MSGSGYDTAQICLNGHKINTSVTEFPDHNKDFCSKCGKKTITECQNCNTPIRGRYIGSLLISYVPPSYCHNCGSEYPWTETALEAAKQLADEFDGISAEEKEQLKESLNDLVSDGPKTKLAENRFNKIMTKVGSEGYEIMKGILINIVTESVRKGLFP